MGPRLLACERVGSTLEEGANFGEGGIRPHERDEGSLHLEIITESLEEYIDELAISHGITQLMKLVGHHLEALAVDAEGRGTLDGVVDLGVEVVDPSIDVVLKETAKGSP